MLTRREIADQQRFAEVTRESLREAGFTEDQALAIVLLMAATR